MEIETVTLPAKPFWKSKIFWLGLINIVIGILQYIAGQWEVGAKITLDGILIIILRSITDRGIKIT